MTRLELAALPTEPAHAQATAATGAAQTVRPGAARDGQATDVRVALSHTGRILAGSEPGKTADIDDSNLPDYIKEALKRIRELRAKLQEKLQELHAAMADTRLSKDQRQARVQSLQSEVATLSGALTDATAALPKLLRDASLSPEQMMTASLLVMS